MPSIGAVEIVTTSFAVSALLPIAIDEEDVVLSPPREENMVSWTLLFATRREEDKPNDGFANASEGWAVVANNATDRIAVAVENLI